MFLVFWLVQPSATLISFRNESVKSQFSRVIDETNVRYSMFDTRALEEILVVPLKLEGIFFSNVWQSDQKVLQRYCTDLKRRQFYRKLSPRQNVSDGVG